MISGQLYHPDIFWIYAPPPEWILIQKLKKKKLLIREEVFEFIMNELHLK